MIEQLIYLVAGGLIYLGGYLAGKRAKRLELRGTKQFITGRWKRNVDPATAPMRDLRSRGACQGCGAKAEEWCRDDCRYMDPWDYR